MFERPGGWLRVEGRWVVSRRRSYVNGCVEHTSGMDIACDTTYMALSSETSSSSKSLIETPFTWYTGQFSTMSVGLGPRNKS